MKPLTLLMTLLPVIAFGSIDKSPDDFFRPAPLPPEAAQGELLFPKGGLFPFSFYSVGGGPRTPGGGVEELPEAELQALFKEYKAAGFQIIGPQYALNERSLADAKEHGFKVIYSVGLSKKAFRAHNQEALPEAEIREEIRKEVSAVAGNRDIIAWDLRPEELRPWRKGEKAYLDLAVQTIREADPHQRPIYHYCPGHYTARSLAQIAPYVQLLGKGMYTNYSSQKQSRVWCRWTVEQEVEAIRESGSKAVPLALAEMFQQPEPEEVARIPEWVRHDVYLSLVSGARGVLVFSLRKRADFPAWQAYYDAYRQVGSELLLGDKLGQVFLFGEKRTDLAVEIVDGPTTVEFTFRSADLNEPVRYPSIHWAEFAYGKERYLFAVNSANEACTAVVSGFPYDAVNVEPLSGKSRTSFPVGEGEFQTTFAPLEVKIYRFTRK